MDLVNLFSAPTPTPAFAQGTLVTFNPLTGANTVNVNGSVYTNLPLLNVPDVVNMVAGSVVMLAQLGGSYAILGRVVVPGSGVLNTSAISIQGTSGSQPVTTITTASTVYLNFTLQVPAWADVVSIMAVGNVTCKNSTAASDIVNLVLAYSTGLVSVGGGSTSIQAAAGTFTSIGCAVAGAQSAVIPGGVVVFSLAANTSLATWTTPVGEFFNFDGIAIFQRV